MLSHISIEAPTIRNEKVLHVYIIKEKLSEMFIFTIGLFQREVILMQSILTA